MIKNGIIITRNKVIDTKTGCGGSLEVCLSDDETGETIVWRKDLMEMVEEASGLNVNKLQDTHSIEWQIDVITAAIFRLEESLGKEDARWREREPFYKIIQNPKNPMYSIYNKLGDLTDEEIQMIQTLRETA